MNHEERITCCEIACAIGSDVAEPTYAVKLVVKRVLRSIAVINRDNASTSVLQKNCEISLVVSFSCLDRCALIDGSNATAAVVCNMVAASDACDYIVQGPCT